MDMKIRMHVLYHLHDDYIFVNNNKQPKIVYLKYISMLQNILIYLNIYCIYDQVLMTQLFSINLFVSSTAALTDVSTKLPPTVSQTSLTASQAPVLSPLHPTSLRQLPPTPVLSSPHTFESLPPVSQIGLLIFFVITAQITLLGLNVVKQVIKYTIELETT